MFCLAKDIFLWMAALQFKCLEGDEQDVPLLKEEEAKSGFRPSLPPQQNVASPELQQSHSALGGQQASMDTGSFEDFFLRKGFHELESSIQKRGAFPQELNGAVQKTWEHDQAETASATFCKLRRTGLGIELLKVLVLGFCRPAGRDTLELSVVRPKMQPMMVLRSQTVGAVAFDEGFVVGSLSFVQSIRVSGEEHLPHLVGTQAQQKEAMSDLAEGRDTAPDLGGIEPQQRQQGRYLASRALIDVAFEEERVEEPARPAGVLPCSVMHARTFPASCLHSIGHFLHGPLRVGLNSSQKRNRLASSDTLGKVSMHGVVAGLLHCKEASGLSSIGTPNAMFGDVKTKAGDSFPQLPFFLGHGGGSGHSGLHVRQQLSGPIRGELRQVLLLDAVETGSSSSSRTVLGHTVQAEEAGLQACRALGMEGSPLAVVVAEEQMQPQLHLHLRTDKGGAVPSLQKGNRSLAKTAGQQLHLGVKQHGNGEPSAWRLQVVFHFYKGNIEHEGFQGSIGAEHVAPSGLVVKPDDPELAVAVEELLHFRTVLSDPGEKALYVSNHKTDMGFAIRGRQLTGLEAGSHGPQHLFDFAAEGTTRPLRFPLAFLQQPLHFPYGLKRPMGQSRSGTLLRQRLSSRFAGFAFSLPLCHEHMSVLAAMALGVAALA